MRRARPVRRLRYSRPPGTVTLRIPRHTLQLGRYRLRLIAIDAAGNRSAALRTRVRVRR
jgi:hypothetical protein